MRIALITLGSLGDIYPLVALGQGLHAAGHKAMLITHAPFELFVRSRGLEFYPIANDPQQMLKDEAGQDWLDAGSNPLRFFRQFGRIAQSIVQQSTVDCWQGLQGADALVYSTMALSIALPMAEKLGIPSCMAAMYPLAPTSDYASPYLPMAPGWLPFGRAYNRLTFNLVIQGFWRLLRSASNQALQQVVGLPPRPGNWLGRIVRQNRLQLLYAYSPAFLPPPRDWKQYNHVTGYWFLPPRDAWQPPAELQAFLDAGPPPVYVGFGSMHNRDPQATTRLVVEALARSGQRGILLTGWGGLSNAQLPASVYSAESIPHDWLFPRTSAIVHHGGSGTTGAALRAGVPSIIIPYFGDQQFWGQRVHAVGVGTEPIPRATLTVEKLTAAITQAVEDQEMRRRAANLGERVRSEDGVARAVEVIEQVFMQGRGIPIETE